MRFFLYFPIKFNIPSNKSHLQDKGPTLLSNHASSNIKCGILSEFKATLGSKMVFFYIFFIGNQYTLY